VTYVDAAFTFGNAAKMCKIACREKHIASVIVLPSV
jgi:hypothetical protein